MLKKNSKKKKTHCLAQSPGTRAGSELDYACAPVCLQVAHRVPSRACMCADAPIRAVQHLNGVGQQRVLCSLHIMRQAEVHIGAQCICTHPLPT